MSGLFIISCVRTCIGFKWLGNRALQLRAAGVKVLFTYEEALGYCVGDVVCDKDGISAGSVFLEMVNELASREGARSYTDLVGVVHRRLQWLYAKYGQFVSYNSYVVCHDPKKTDAIFARIRSAGDGGGRIMRSAGSAVVTVKDVTLGYDSTAPDGKSSLPVTPDSHMIMYEFDNGVSVTLRTSGTEPKIKFYTEIAGKPGQQFQQLHDTLHAFVDKLVDELLQPTENGLARA